MTDKIVAVYQYRDLSGTVVHETVRYEPKRFTQRRPDGKGGYIYNLRDIEPVLYRLPEITAAKAFTPIIVVEGGKDADNLANLGYQATTSPMGAGKWHLSYSIYLEDATVVILPDNDPAGTKHAVQVLESLYWITQGVKIVRLPGGHKDVSDWIAAGGTPEHLDEIINAAHFSVPLHVLREYDRLLKALKMQELFDEIQSLLTNSLPRDEFKVQLIEWQLQRWKAALEYEIPKKGGVDLTYATART
jgi:DNA primase